MLVREEWKRPAGDTTHSQLQVPLLEAGWGKLWPSTRTFLFTQFAYLWPAQWASKKATFQSAIWANTVHFAYHCTNQQWIPPSWSFVSCFQHLIHDLSILLVGDFSHGVTWIEAGQKLQAPSVQILHFCIYYVSCLRTAWENAWLATAEIRPVSFLTQKALAVTVNCSKQGFSFESRGAIIRLLHILFWAISHGFACKFIMKSRIIINMQAIHVGTHDTGTRPHIQSGQHMK